MSEARIMWVGNLSPGVDSDMLRELLINAGPIDSVSIPYDKNSKRPKSFGFVTFRHEQSVDYAMQLFKDTMLFGQPLLLDRRTVAYNSTPKEHFEGRPMENGRHFQGFSQPRMPMAPPAWMPRLQFGQQFQGILAPWAGPRPVSQYNNHNNQRKHEANGQVYRPILHSERPEHHERLQHQESRYRQERPYQKPHHHNERVDHHRDNSRDSRHHMDDYVENNNGRHRNDSRRDDCNRPSDRSRSRGRRDDCDDRRPNHRYL